MDREAIEEAIEVLEDASAEMLTETGNENYYVEAITILRQALETEQKTAVSPGKGTGFNYFRASPITVLRLPQEPVAWISDSPTKGNGKQLHWTKSEAWRWSSNITPLYTAPLKKEWVGLTDEEIEEIQKSLGIAIHRSDFRAIEAKLKEKNT
jgi:hypothetical protein